MTPTRDLSGITHHSATTNIQEASGIETVSKRPSKSLDGKQLRKHLKHLDHVATQEIQFMDHQGVAVS